MEILDLHCHGHSLVIDDSFSLGYQYQAVGNRTVVQNIRNRFAVRPPSG
jgi:hypothetical protein